MSIILYHCTTRVFWTWWRHGKMMFFGYERFPKTKLTSYVLWYISKIKDCTTHRYTYIYIYIYIYTLTGHFIRYTLLVPGWTPFCLQNCLNYSWHRFNKVLETFLRDFGPYWHDSITQLLYICWLHIHDANLRSTTSQRCSIGLRSGDCGGHLSKVNSLSCSRNQSEMIWALWLR